MTVFETSNNLIISYYSDYQRIKQLIKDMEMLKTYLLENNIIKQSESYTVLKHDKFSYSYSLKLNKLLLKEYITTNQQEIYLDITDKYYNYVYNINNNNEIVNLVNSRNLYNLTDLTQFRMNKLLELKYIIKTLIKTELNNKRIRVMVKKLIRWYEIKEK